MSATTALSTADVDGYAMSYAVRGVGEPVVLVHGALSDYRYWSAQMETLSAGFQVLAPSLRHHFPDSWSGDCVAYTVTQHVRDLLGFIRATGCGPVHLVGHSRGGHVALEAALAQPAAVRSLVLADPAVPIEAMQEHADVAAPQRAGCRRAALDMIRRGEVEAGIEAFINAVAGEGVWSRMNGRRKQIARDNARALVGQYDDVLTPVRLQAISSLPVPMLLVGGERSPAPYPAILQALSGARPEAGYVKLRGTSHSMNAEDPANFNKALRDFLEQVTG